MPLICLLPLYEMKVAMLEGLEFCGGFPCKDYIRPQLLMSPEKQSSLVKTIEYWPPPGSWLYECSQELGTNPVYVLWGFEQL